MYTKTHNTLDAARRYILNRLRDGSYAIAALLHEDNQLTTVLDIGEEDRDDLLALSENASGDTVTLLVRHGIERSDAPGDVDIALVETDIQRETLVRYLDDMQRGYAIQGDDVEPYALATAALLHLFAGPYVLYALTDKTDHNYVVYTPGEMPVRRLLEQAGRDGNQGDLLVHRIGWATPTSIDDILIDHGYILSHRKSVRLGDTP